MLSLRTREKHTGWIFKHIMILVIFLQASLCSLVMGEKVFEGTESVVLPCHFSDVLPEVNPAVIWSRYDVKPRIVHLRREKDDLLGQNQQFSGRTTMKSDALDSGDFSLTLRKPNSSDSGIYTCSISDYREEIRLTDVQLQVKVQQVEVKVQEGEESAILPCKTTAHMEEDDTVEWSRSEPEFMIVHVYQNGRNTAKDKFDRDRTRMNKEQVKSGDLSLTLRDPTERDSGVYICTIYRKSDVVRLKVILHFVKEKFPSWAKAFLVLLIFLLIFGGLLFHFRQYLQSIYKVEVDSGMEFVTLPCKTIVRLPEDVTITWRNNTRQIVHIYQASGKKLEQHKHYKDRTEMKGNVKYGDSSLILKNPTDRDTDTYTCIISTRWGKVLIKKQVLLHVKAGSDSFIIAIDIGSGFSGYAFNIKPREEGSETQIKRWGKELGLDAPKTPTCILLDEHGRLVNFGYKAKTTFTSMRREEAGKHYFLENFKMVLNCSDLRNQTIKAANNKSIKAFKVFTEVLGYLRDDALETIKAQAKQGEFTASDFTWVLTVPANWGHPAKQFMRDSATMAGLVTKGTKDKLMFVLESEAALTWCLKLQPDGFITQNHSKDSQDQPGAAEPDTSCNGLPKSEVAVDIKMKQEETIGLLNNHKRNGEVYVLVDCGEHDSTMGDSAVIAIDFGTAYSGYTFNTKVREEESDPKLKRWGAEQGLDTPKTPTCILFDQNGEFLSFGYEAKTAYLKMRGEEAKKHYFFEGFKMVLHGKGLNRNLKLKATNNKEMEAMKVFSESLRFLKDDAIKTINAKTEGLPFIFSDFTWVLTVPTIWDLSAKQFMREAATQAGIITEGDEDKLVLALEPEAASVWCKKLPADGFITQNHNAESLDQTPGTQYLIVDCGGGTIDITVHKILGGGSLKELDKASGNNMGGQTVDKKFKEFLKEIFSDGVWDEYEQNYPSEVQKMIFDFTRLKQVDEDIEIPCPYNLGKLAKRKKDIEKFFETVEGASWNEGFIKITREKLRSFFDKSLQGITNSLNEILQNDFNIGFILLVGGFAESQILRQLINEQFGEKYKILCPVRPQEVILRGAIEFGRNPKIVAYRKSRFTYGVAVLKRFDESEHKQEKKLTADGKEWCQDIFKILLEEGEDVGWDETREHLLTAVDTEQTQMSVRLFRTEKKNPKYVDDYGMEEVGSFIVKLCDSERNKERKVKMELKFGSTEITATGTDLSTGEKSTLKFKFKNL